MDAVSYPLQIPKNVMKLVNLRTEEEHVDESTALMQLLFMGAQDYVIELYNQGRISLGRAADMLGVSTFDVIAIARERGIRIGAAERKQRNDSSSCDMSSCRGGGKGFCAQESFWKKKNFASYKTILLC